MIPTALGASSWWDPCHLSRCVTVVAPESTREGKAGVWKPVGNGGYHLSSRCLLEEYPREMTWGGGGSPAMEQHVILDSEVDLISSVPWVATMRQLVDRKAMKFVLRINEI
jgi:hypothetical protein